MIGPVHNFAALYPSGQPSSVRPSGLTTPHPKQAALDFYAAAVGRGHGLLFQPGEATGQAVVVPQPDGSTLYLRRTSYYALVEPDEIMEGVRAIVEMAAREFGPGRAWTLAGRVHLIRDEDAPPVVPPNGVIYARDYRTDAVVTHRFTPGRFVWWLDDIGDGIGRQRIRAWIAHENGPRDESPAGGAS